MTNDPAHEYEARRDARRRRALDLAGREQALALARVLLALSVMLLACLWLRLNELPPWWLGLFVAAFVVLLFVHDAVFRATLRARRAAAYYEAGLRRLRDDWKGTGQQGARFADEGHPYAADLDLFGPGSLFELLCTARTRTGEDTLAAWLKEGAAPNEVLARQAAVVELRPMLDLREDLALLGSDVPQGVDFDGVAAWGEEPVLLTHRWPRWLALAFGLITVTCAIGFVMRLGGVLDPRTAFGEFFLRHGPTPMVAMLAVQGVFLLFFIQRVGKVLGTVEKSGRDLGMLARVLARLEEAPFTSPRLAGLLARLKEGSGGPGPRREWSSATVAGLLARLNEGDGGLPPSQRIAALANLIDLLNSRRNQFFAPFAYLMMWGTQMAHDIESWRARNGPDIRRWLDAVGQFEALGALATYAYECPADPFPELSPEGPLLDAVGLAHPLLPRGQCVANDVALGRPLRVLVVSGSNMSGKSTFLRTIGVNVVLALAGAPVRAKRLRLSPLVLGATLRIQDSLQAGRSRFYAEVLRVKQVVSLSRGPVPLLFLLDEIFAGTNSHDRQLGARAVVKGLVDAGAVGLVTTHDLALAGIADELGDRAENVHFADRFDEGTLEFDYTLRPGVVRHSNAVALMRAVGLEV